jgi:MFS family permease
MSLIHDQLPANQDSNVAQRVPVEHANILQKLGLETLLMPLRERNFRFLVIGQVISTLGDMFYFVAFPWLILNSDGGARELGAVLAIFGVARIGSTALGGVLSDRWHPLNVMLLTDIMRALLIGLLALVAFSGHPAFWQLCILLIPLGIFEGLFLPAYLAITPRMLPESDLQAGNSLGQTANLLAVIAGPAIAGLMVARLQPGIALTVDALTFVLSAFSLILIQRNHISTEQQSQISQTDAADQDGSLQAATNDTRADQVTQPQQGSSDETISFWHFLRTSSLLQIALVLIALTNITADGTMGIALPTFAHGQLHAGADGYGYLLAIFGIGTLLGALVSGAIGRLKQRGIFATCALLVQAGALVILPLGGIFGAAFALCIAGISSGVVSILFLTMIQQLPPRYLLGRVMGIFMVVTSGLYPVSVALAGVVIAHWSASFMFIASGIVLCIACVVGLLNPNIRRI